MISGGFPQVTPKGEVEILWAENLQPQVAAAVDLTGVAFESPFKLSSILHLRCAAPAQATQTIAYVRKVQPRIPYGTSLFSIYATIQKPKDIKTNHRFLFRSAETLQKYLQPHIKSVVPYEAVCWRSSNIILANRRICKVTRGISDNELKITFFPSWYSSDMFVNPAAVIEQSVKKLLDADQ